MEKNSNENMKLLNNFDRKMHYTLNFKLIENWGYFYSSVVVILI